MVNTLRSRIRQLALLGCASGAGFLALAVGQVAAAHADVSSVYPPEAQSRTFTSGNGNWTASKKAVGLLNGLLCIEGLTCPTVKNEYKPSGGMDGEGYLETSEGGLTSILGLLEGAVSTGIYESPAFTYGGAGGQVPTKVEFSLGRHSTLAGLLAVSKAEATYSVELVDETSPSGSVVVIDSQPLEGAEAWKTSSATVAPSSLAVGHSYKVRITTKFTTPVAVLPAGGVGYDNVALTATKVDSSNGGNGENGGNGNGGGGKGGENGEDIPVGKGANGGAGGGVSSARLESLIRSSSLIGPAVLKGNKLTVKAACPKKVGTTCTLTLRGQLTKKKAATTARRARVKQGKNKQFVLKVKPAALAKVKKAKKLLFKETVRAGKAKTTVWKSLKLVRK